MKERLVKRLVLGFGLMAILIGFVACNGVNNNRDQAIYGALKLLCGTPTSLNIDDVPEVPPSP